MNNDHSDSEITTLLNQLNSGDISIQNELVDKIYDVVHGFAERAMLRERRDHTLQATALVNETILKIIRDGALQGVDNRRLLYAIVCKTMWRTLVNHARRRNRVSGPAGSGRKRVPLDWTLESFEAKEKLNVLDLADALDQLESRAPRQHEVVTLHFFSGFKFKEIAEHLDVSLSTVEKDWKFARSWLLDHMERRDG